jgi:hypothetical protein
LLIGAGGVRRQRDQGLVVVSREVAVRDVTTRSSSVGAGGGRERVGPAE